MRLKDILCLIRNLLFGNSISPIGNHETISRFAFSKSVMSPKLQRLKHNAFLLRSSGPNEISVYRVDGISENIIWCLGQKYVGNKSRPARNLKGRGDIKVENICNMDFSEIELSEDFLSIRPAPRPHRRHANIYFQRNLDDAKKIHIANKLSMASKLFKAPKQEDISLECCSKKT